MARSESILRLSERNRELTEQKKASRVAWAQLSKQQPLVARRLNQIGQTDLIFNNKKFNQNTEILNFKASEFSLTIWT